VGPRHSENTVLILLCRIEPFFILSFINREWICHFIFLPRFVIRDFSQTVTSVVEVEIVIPDLQIVLKS